MAMSTIRRRHEAERLRAEAYDIVLRHAARGRRPPPDFARALDEAGRGFGRLAIREAAVWQPKLKSRDAAKLRLAAARHLYARYPVPACLEQVWLDGGGLEEAEIALRKRWYIAAARGDSLHAAGAGEWLTRKEVHRLQNAPAQLGFEEAFWHAIALTYTQDGATALRIAKSKIARMPRGQIAFWRDVAQFFAANPATAAEIDDLVDFLADRRQRVKGFGLKGRTLASLTRQMREWHRDLAVRARQAAERQAAARAMERVVGQTVETERWAGASMPDWAWKPQAKGARAQGEIWTLRQLRTVKDLAAETQAMHHCVVMYASKCIAGHASIWSLQRTDGGVAKRLLTIEVDRHRRAVQVRGFANRGPTPEEQEVLARWAKAHGVDLPH